MSKITRVTGGDWVLRVDPDGQIVLDGEVRVAGQLVGDDTLLDDTLAVISRDRSIRNVVYISMDDYRALSPPDPSTLYIITSTDP